MPEDGGSGRKTPARGLLGWCLYDWANSAFPTVITTFVFAAYFTEAVARDTVTGTAQWGVAISSAGLAVAVMGPILGAIADHGGRRKPWVLAFTALCVIASALLWMVRPDASNVVLALTLVAVATVCFEMGTVFYNAMLPDLVARDRIGRLSGWGWGLGYAGGLACLGLVLVALVQAETPVFGLDKDQAEHLRATGPLVAMWFAVFAVPFVLWTPDRPASGLTLGEAARRGVRTLVATIKKVRDFAHIVRFLIAHVMYHEGLDTLFAFGGIYAAGTFGMDFEELIVFGIAINVTAGLGAFAFAWVDDWIGPKRTIMIALVGLASLGTALLLVEEKTMFWAFALPLGIFVGPLQSASRSMMARLAPSEMMAEMFGLYALSGKSAAFVGPAVLALMTTAFASQRAGMATILVFFALGFALIMTVPDPKD